eukprot:CAMPEP_0194482690 /NCGR_PEP_ID=MMETSP0253-20130528/4523_1 /TAXON_ID=2966 /ORGANISM="Noctiluca scintillans" /LENGTH=266 /DNA_ID=CAMNT_0039322243 /DNA_START=68 /DNA_END=868 /DNA_ORIENTATION=+
MSYVTAVNKSNESRQADGQKSPERETSQKIQELVKNIQQHASEIKKESNALGSVSAASQRPKAEKAFAAGQASAEDARKLLQSLGSDQNCPNEHKRLTHQKLSESLGCVTRELEDTWRVFQASDAERAKRNSLSSQVEMQEDLEAARTEPLLQGEQAAMLEDVSLADVETHAEIVQEYAQAVSRVASDVLGLHRALVDLADHARSSGDALGSIESNMSLVTGKTEAATKEVAKASRQQEANTKRLCWALCIVSLLCLTTIGAVAMR